MLRPTSVARSRPIELSSDTEYFALSHVWGERTNTTMIQLDGVSFEITVNLHAALKRFSLNGMPRRLWVDAICIDQFSNEEKSSQIPLMGRIYSQARGVFMWLGEESEDSDLGHLHPETMG